MAGDRYIQNQGEIAVYGPESVNSSQVTTELKLTVNSGQAWRIQSIDLEAPPNAEVALKYKEEVSGNELSLGTYYQYEFPLVWKPTSTDNHLVIWEDRELSFQVTNSKYTGEISARAKVTYIKVYLERRGGS